MAQDYLESLSLSDEDKAKLQSMGMQSPFALLSIIKASPDAFEAFMGKEKTAQLAQELEAKLSEDERSLLETPLPLRKTGAIIDRERPPLRTPSYDIGERDRLFDELQALRQRPEKTSALGKRIAELEERLNALLQDPEDLK